MKRFTYIFGLALAVIAVSSCSVEYRTVARTPDVIVEPTVIITNRTTYRTSLLYRIFHRRPAPAPYYSHRPTPPPPAPAPKHNANPAPAPSHNTAPAPKNDSRPRASVQSGPTVNKNAATPKAAPRNSVSANRPTVAANSTRNSAPQTRSAGNASRSNSASRGNGGGAPARGR